MQLTYAYQVYVHTYIVMPAIHNITAREICHCQHFSFLLRNIFFPGFSFAISFFLDASSPCRLFKMMSCTPEWQYPRHLEKKYILRRYVCPKKKLPAIWSRDWPVSKARNKTFPRWYQSFWFKAKTRQKVKRTFNHSWCIYILTISRRKPRVIGLSKLGTYSKACLF